MALDRLVVNHYIYNAIEIYGDWDARDLDGEFHFRNDNEMYYYGMDCHYEKIVSYLEKQLNISGLNADIGKIMNMTLSEFKDYIFYLALAAEERNDY